MAQKASTQNVPTQAVSQYIDNEVTVFGNQRRTFERHWYDNNFFDDGYHFRYVSRTTGKIIDLSRRADLNIPERAIPKASRQIRGIANLLVAPNYTPTFYPDKAIFGGFGSDVDPNNPQFKAMMDQAKDRAKRLGYWMGNEWEEQDLKLKLTEMIILAAKNYVSYMQVWPDPVKEEICTPVFDAFDIYLMGTVKHIEDSPALIKAVPQFIEVIKANEQYDEEQLSKITADNKYASSEIKQAYMQAKYGASNNPDQAATLIEKEAFHKEYLNDDNWELVSELGADNGAMEGKSRGDLVMRHTFSAGGVWLKDEYLPLEQYPFVDLRLEPGPMYGVPLMQRFIPANKSLDIAMSRVERWFNSMVAGIWLKRKGEDMTITNAAGGQIVEYSQTPPAQMNMTNMPPTTFDFIQLLNKIIEEQGASTSALGQLPSGVKSGVAIENVKQIEYANLKIPGDMVKEVVKKISEKFLDIADRYYVHPKTVERTENGNPDYFDVIGNTALKQREALGVPLEEEAIPIRSDYKVDIEIENDLGYTMQGKKETMQQIITFMTQLAQQQLIPAEAVKIVVGKFLEIFQFGATAEFMDAMDEGLKGQAMSEEQLQQMKIAVAEVLKDIGVGGQAGDQRAVDATKLGTLEALKESGLAEQMGQSGQPAPEAPKPPSRSISFKDLPPAGKQQMAAQAGIQLAPQDVVEPLVPEGV